MKVVPGTLASLHFWAALHAGRGSASGFIRQKGRDGEPLRGDAVSAGGLSVAAAPKSEEAKGMYRKAPEIVCCSSCHLRGRISTPHCDTDSPLFPVLKRGSHPESFTLRLFLVCLWSHSVSSGGHSLRTLMMIFLSFIKHQCHKQMV